MMRIKFLRGTGLGGIGNDAQPGDVRELDDGLARSLIAAGRAEPAPDADEPAPVAESADPKPKRKAKA